MLYKKKYIEIFQIGKLMKNNRAVFVQYDDDDDDKIWRNSLFNST